MTFFVEKFFGERFKFLFLAFLVLFMVIVGAVFAKSPAQMLADLTKIDFIYWICIVFVYYFIATLLPIDKVIGRIYPFFAVLLLITTVAILFVLLFSELPFYPNASFANQNPEKLPLFPLMFVTIACGAISGFHATQSPMMVRCLTNEKWGRPIFYGAMITEGAVALIWATLGIAFLSQAIHQAGPGGVVALISQGFLGKIGGILTVLSVVILSITSGDTAFRSARLILADFIHLPQKHFWNRVFLSLCVLTCGVGLSVFNITTIWRYFGWANQTLAAITLWICCLYLRRQGRCYWITFVPAVFMTAVCMTYILYEKMGFGLSLTIAQGGGSILALAAGIFFLWKKKIPS